MERRKKGSRMDNLKLNELMTKYVNIDSKIESLKNEKEYLKDSILELMGENLVYDNGYTKATITCAEGFKYNDEVSVINKLKQFGYERFVIEKVDTKPANAFFKAHPDNPLTESLKNSNDISSSITVKLSVKEV